MSTTTTSLREPMDLPQLDSMSCYTNVIAQIRWMFGISDTEGLDAVREVDALTGRPPDELSEGTPQLQLLADEGCRIRGIGEFNIDEVRADPLAHIKKRIRDEWSPAHDEWWTEDHLRAFIERAEQFVETLLRHPNVRFEQRRPALSDVSAAIDDGMLVPLLIKNFDAGSAHAMLVFGRHNGYFQGYDPNRAPEGMLYSAEWLERQMMPSEAVYAIGAPS